MYGVVGKDDLSSVGSFQDTGCQQGMYVAMNAFYIPPQPARCFANGERPGACHRPEEVPALSGQDLEEKLG